MHSSHASTTIYHTNLSFLYRQVYACARIQTLLGRIDGIAILCMVEISILHPHRILRRSNGVTNECIHMRLHIYIKPLSSPLLASPTMFRE